MKLFRFCCLTASLVVICLQCGSAAFAQGILDEAGRASVSFDGVKHLIDANKKVVEDRSANTAKRLKSLSNLGNLLVVYDDVGGEMPDFEELRKSTIYFVLAHLVQPADGYPPLTSAAADVIHQLREHSVPLLIVAMGNDASAMQSTGEWKLTVPPKPIEIAEVVVIRRLVDALADYAKTKNTGAGNEAIFRVTIEVMEKVLFAKKQPNMKAPPLYPTLLRERAFSALTNLTFKSRTDAKQPALSDHETQVKIYAALSRIAKDEDVGGSFREAAARALASDVTTAEALKPENAAVTKSVVGMLFELSHTSTDRFVRRAGIRGIDSLVKDGKILIPEGKRTEYMDGLFGLVDSDDIYVRGPIAGTIGSLAKATLANEERIYLKDLLIGALNNQTLSADVRPVLVAALQSVIQETHLSQLKAAVLSAVAVQKSRADELAAASKKQDDAKKTKKTAEDELNAANARAMPPNNTPENLKLVEEAKANFGKATENEKTAEKDVTEATKRKSEADADVKDKEDKLSAAKAALGVSAAITSQGGNSPSSEQPLIPYFISTDVARVSQTGIFATSSARASTWASTWGAARPQDRATIHICYSRPNRNYWRPSENSRK